MPAGIVKTPNTARAKDANAKSADRNANGNDSGGKKFVQTRLPFKLLTPVAKGAAATTAAAAAATSATPTEEEAAEQVAREPRKRKLSYGDKERATGTATATEGELELRRSNSKENLKQGVAVTAPSKKSKIVEQSMAEDVIELDDDDDDDDNEVDDNDEKQQAKQSKKTADSAHHPSPVQIKLPLGNKRGKRRKPQKKPEAAKSAPVAKASDSSDDIEALAESLNPQKRVKVAPIKPKASPRNQTTVQTKLTAGKAKPQPKAKPETQTKATAETAMDVDSDVLLLDSSDNEQSQADAAPAEQSSTDMDVDTDTLKKTSPEKDKDADEDLERVEQLEEEAELVNKSASAVANVAEKLQNLTPKQQRLMEQRRKAREEKERKLQEERRLKQLEKEQREQQKKTERDQKEEQRRKEREDKEELKRKEREEKERKNEEKNEEKRKRNEAKEEVQRKKDEERRRKELEKEEAEEKKKRAAATFTKFFVPKQPKQSGGNGSAAGAGAGSGALEHEQNSCDSGPSHSSSSQTLAFRPFQVKDDMILAPVIRATLGADTRQQLDTLFRVPDDTEQPNDSIGRVKRPARAQLYISELSLGRHKAQRSKRDMRLQRRTKDEEDDDDVQVIDELTPAGTPIVEERPKQLPWTRAKYLHFADNRRPPYYGTWRKRSQLISARRPLGQDKGYFDYEVDSDCEWEEEEPGESLSASEDEKERESEEESEEEYNEWFVPHGHLSDEELQNDGELEDGNTREAQKAKLQVLQQEFAQEMKKQTKKIKPRLLGPVWLDENGNKSQLCPAVFIQTIDMYGSWQLQPLTLEPPPEPQREEESPAMQLDEQLLQQLVRLIHGNSNAKAFLISEYLEYLKTQIKQESETLPPKTLLREKFDELASWKPVELPYETKRSKKPKKRLSWVVSADVLHKYQLDDLPLQNQWSYTLTPRMSKADTSLREASPPPETSETIGTTKSEASKLSKRVDSTPNTPTTAIGSPAAAGGAATSAGKKRGTLLMSVPRDQQFHAPTKNALISQFLRKPNDEPTSTKKKKTPPAISCSKEVVLLSD